MQPLRYNLATGQVARNYRKRLAACCERPGKPILTTKFRLDCKNCQKALNQLSLETTNSLYNVLEGTGKGSLTYLVFTLQACGFRIFGTSTQAEVFAGKNAYKDKDFSSKVKEIVEKEWKEFTPSNIVVRLKKGVRTRGGKDNRFVFDVIYREYAREFKSSGNEIREKIIQTMAKALSSKFSSWKDLKDRMGEACSAVDEALESACGIPLPRIADMYAAAQNSALLPENTTICFDPESVPYSCDSSILPYCAVATALQTMPENTADKQLVSYAQNSITTGNSHSGLSWLLGKGLSLIRESSVEELSTAYGVPQNRMPAVRQLKEAVDAIPPQKFFKFSKKDESTYPDFRQNLGGHLDSWIANYVKRLIELKDMLDKIPVIQLPNDLSGEEYSRLFEGVSTSRADVEFFLKNLNSERADAYKSLQKLLGRDVTPVKEDVDRVISFSNGVNYLVSLRESLSNAINNSKRKSSDPQYYEKAQNALKEWENFPSFPKLNSLSGGTHDIVAEIETDAADFQTITNAFLCHVEKLRKWLASSLTILENQIKNEDHKLTRRQIPGVTSFEQAIRYLLDSIGKTARMHPGPICDRIREWFLQEGIFSEKKKGSHAYLNTYFINRKWSLYKDPSSTRRNFVYPIKRITSFEEAEELWKRLWELCSSLAHDESVISVDYDGAWALRTKLVILEVSRVTRDVPADVAAISLPDRFMKTLPGLYTAQLNRGSVSANVFRTAFNSYTSVLSGLNIRLRRQIFYLRTKFTWIGNTELLYVPKDTSWAVPERYRSVPEWKDILGSDKMVWRGTKLDVKNTFEKLKKDLKDRSNLPLIRLLVQMPHDWFYELPVDVPDKTEISAISVKNCQAKEVRQARLARLVGPSNMKSRLDACLLASHEEAIGDMTLLYDVKVHQNASLGKASFEHEDPMLSLAIPIRESMEGRSSKSPAFSRIVAIDQGEAGLAYAVFNLSDFGNEEAQPIMKGTVRIRSIRRLIKAGNVFRKGKQLVQKFNQRFDSTMFNMRENVAGDVCSVIEGLMRKFHAFPVLENEVRNLESGSRQLILVYKAVNNRFLRSDSDMPNAERIAWWYGADAWIVPGFNFIKKNGKLIPLRVYPGISVPAANTSRICSICRRNAFEIIRTLKERHQNRITVQKDGTVSLEGFPDLRLFREVQDDSLRSQYIRQNLNVPMLDPAKAGELSIDGLKALISNNLRRKPASRQSKDTKQSVYYCVFRDCPSHENEWIQDPSRYRGLKILRERHADINAAINIGRRFLNNGSIIKDNGNSK